MATERLAYARDLSFLRFVSNGRSKVPINVLSIAPHIGLEIDAYNPTNQDVTYAITVGSFARGTLEFKEVANMYNKKTKYNSVPDERVYTKVQYPLLREIPLHLSSSEKIHGNAAQAKVYGTGVKVTTELVEHSGNKYPITKVTVMKNSGVCGERFAVGMTITQQHAYAFVLRCYRLDQDFATFQHDYIFVLRNGSTDEEACRKAAELHFPNLWNTEEYGNGVEHNLYISNEFRKLIPPKYIHPALATPQQVTKRTIVQEIVHKGTMDLSDLTFERNKPKISKKAKVLIEKTPKRKQKEASSTPRKRQKKRKEPHVEQEANVKPMITAQYHSIGHSYEASVTQSMPFQQSPSPSPSASEYLSNGENIDIPDGFVESHMLAQFSNIQNSDEFLPAPPIVESDFCIEQESEIDICLASSNQSLMTCAFSCGYK
jgi:hypothetical protein